MAMRNRDFTERQAWFAFENELIVDLFAGGGGASEGIEQAFGRPVDVAINHNPIAVAVHWANHPQTKHYCEDVYAVDPLKATRGLPVGLLHASPDCTHHSQARGGQPRDAVIRSLSWVVVKWAALVKPRVITLENVEQILQWSPLVAKRDKGTRLVVTLELIPDPARPGRTMNRVAYPGERVPLQNQFLIPCKRRRGRSWDNFVGSLRGMGYAVQWKKIKACDAGAPTSRTRLFMVARCDGEPIKWPAPTHGKGKGLLPYRTAAECIDWSIPAPSIFNRPARGKKDLADATLRRVARGIDRFVINAAEPFIVPNMTNNVAQPVSAPLPTVTTSGRHMLGVPTIVPMTHSGSDRIYDVKDPLCTITTAHRGEVAAVVPFLVPRFGERPTQEPRTRSVTEPAPTVVPTGNGGSLCMAHIVKGKFDSIGHPATDPLCTITAGGAMKRDAGAAHSLGVSVAYLEQASNGGMLGRAASEPLTTTTTAGTQQRVVTAHLATLRRNMVGSAADATLHTISAGAEHHAVVECTLSPEHEEGAMRVAAFLLKYHGSGGQWAELRDLAPTVTAAECLALVTVWIKGDPWVIVDIGLRMLTPNELKLCQGFPADYTIDRGWFVDAKAPAGEWRKITKTDQVKLIGNSVSPHPLRAVVLANCGRLIEHERRQTA